MYNEKKTSTVIAIRPAVFENESRVAVFMPNQKDWIDLIRQVPKSRWSPSHGCWHFPKTKENWTLFQKLFELFDWHIQKEATPLSIPTSEMWERCSMPLKADYVPPQTPPSTPDAFEKKPIRPSSPNPIFFQIEKVAYDGQKFMSLAIPPNDLGSRETIKKIEGRVWHPQERTWLVPMNPPNYEKLKAAFGEALQPPSDRMIREILPPVYPNSPKMPLKPKTKTVENNAAFDSLNGKQQLAVTKLEHLLIEERKQDNTVKGYRNFFINFLLFYKDTTPSLITNEQIRAYIVKRIKEENISKSTQNLMISTFKAFYGRLLNQYDKVNDLYRPNKEEHLPKTLEPDEIKRLFAHVSNIKHRCLLMLMYGSGLRVGELVRLKWRDLDFVEKTVFVHNGKNYKDRYTLLSEKTMAYLKKYKTDYKSTDWVFESPNGGHYSERSVQLLFNEALAKAKIDKQVCTHSLRHAFATQLLKANTDLDFVRKVMGHASIKTTQIYLHVLKTDLTKTRSPMDDLDI